MNPLFLLVAFFVLFCAQPARADLGPKPRLNMLITATDGSSLWPDQASLLICNQADCSDGKPLQAMGAQGFHCAGHPGSSYSWDCSAMAYGFPPYARVVLATSSGQLQSNVFSKSAFAATYEGTLTSSSLTITEK